MKKVENTRPNEYFTEITPYIRACLRDSNLLKNVFKLEGNKSGELLKILIELANRNRGREFYKWIAPNKNSKVGDSLLEEAQKKELYNNRRSLSRDLNKITTKTTWYKFEQIKREETLTEEIVIFYRDKNNLKHFWVNLKLIVIKIGEYLTTKRINNKKIEKIQENTISNNISQNIEENKTVSYIEVPKDSHRSYSYKKNIIIKEEERNKKNSIVAQAKEKFKDFIEFTNWLIKYKTKKEVLDNEMFNKKIAINLIKNHKITKINYEEFIKNKLKKEELNKKRVIERENDIEKLIKRFDELPEKFIIEKYFKIIDKTIEIEYEKNRYKREPKNKNLSIGTNTILFGTEEWIKIINETIFEKNSIWVYPYKEKLNVDYIKQNLNGDYLVDLRFLNSFHKDYEHLFDKNIILHNKNRSKVTLSRKDLCSRIRFTLTDSNRELTNIEDITVVIKFILDENFTVDTI